VLTGDVHRNYDLEILADYDTPGSRAVGVQFAGTSIASGGEGVDTDQGAEDRLHREPHLKVRQPTERLPSLRFIMADITVPVPDGRTAEFYQFFGLRLAGSLSLNQMPSGGSESSPKALRRPPRPPSPRSITTGLVPTIVVSSMTTSAPTWRVCGR
jgi:hypothetical protein